MRRGRWLPRSSTSLPRGGPRSFGRPSAPGARKTAPEARPPPLLNQEFCRAAPTVSVQNLFDKQYVGSVAINAAGTLATAKFYEPAPRRTLIVGLTIGAGR